MPRITPIMLYKIVVIVFCATIELNQLAWGADMQNKAVLTKKRSPSSYKTRKFQLEYTVVDLQNIDISNSQSAVKTFTVSKRPKTIKCDILITGGGMGGLAAALSACKLSNKVCLTEETDWLGGQMTSQGVSALDENYLVETSGATKTYQQLRKSIREHYRKQLQSTNQSNYLNPGNCWVSRLSFEPKIALEKIDELLHPYEYDGLLKVFRRLKTVDIKVIRGLVKSILMVDLDKGTFFEFRPKLCIDATELGDLLPLSKLDYATGAESKQETGEPHAPDIANPENVQDYTYPLVLEFRSGENHIIEKPAQYDQFKDSGKYSFLAYKMFQPNTNYLPFWEYRRLLAKDNFPNSIVQHDLAMINWESNDMRGANIIDQPARIAAERLASAKNLSLGFLYWLQTEAPRDEGGQGYPELYLRADVLGTNDGLSKYPYIRESRRIKANHIIVEQEIAASTNSSSRAQLFLDSVGIGLYPIDIHGHQDVPGAGQESKPFQIPLNALVQSQIRNLLPACKNIGTTHITNGAYRLHPVEWAIGEAAGSTAALSVKKNITPDKIASNKRDLFRLQHSLIEQHMPLFWFDDVPTDHPNFEAIQTMAVANLFPVDENTLSFNPNNTITTDEAESILKKVLSLGVKIRAISYPKSAQKDFLKKFNINNSTQTKAQFAESIYQFMTSHNYFN